jgi:hypothetical protein
MRCLTCTDEAAPDYEDGLCETCHGALTSGVSIEEQRWEVEDAARYWTRHLGSAEGLRCTCGAGCGMVSIPMGPWNYAARIHFDVTHETGCPLAPRPFNWGEVDEDGRERVFGYRGREHHVGRLIEALQKVLIDRQLWEEDVA